MPASGLGFDSGEWAALSVLAFVAGLASSFALLRLLFGALQALAFSLVAAFCVSLAVYSLPFMLAGREEKALERELPVFISILLSVYAEKGNMAAALNSAVRSGDSRIALQARDAFFLYLAGSPAEHAFHGLADENGSILVRRAFTLIARGIESGLDVGGALADVSRDAVSRFERESEREARIGLVSWVISASSAFFFPLFAGLGLAMMGVMQKIAFAGPYSADEQGLIGGAVSFYLFAGVLLDAGYNGQMRFGSFWKGALAFAPVLALAAIAVFVSSLNLAKSLTSG